MSMVISTANTLPTALHLQYFETKINSSCPSFSTNIVTMAKVNLTSNNFILRLILATYKLTMSNYIRLILI